MNHALVEDEQQLEVWVKGGRIQWVGEKGALWVSVVGIALKRMVEHNVTNGRVNNG